MCNITEIILQTRRGVTAVRISDEELMTRIISLKKDLPQNEFMKMIAALEGRDDDYAEILKEDWTIHGFNRIAGFIENHRNEIVSLD